MNRLKGVLAGSVLAGAVGLAYTQAGNYDGGGYPGGAGYPEGRSTTEETMQTSEIKLPPNVTPGWKIRICSEKTKADAIKFKFSLGETKTDKRAASKEQAAASETHDFMAWNQGQKTLIELPLELRDVEKLRIEAIPTDDDKDKEALVCVLFNDHVAKKMSFDNREVSTVKSTESGECGC